MESPKWVMEANWNKHLDKEESNETIQKNKKVREKTLKEVRRLLGNLYQKDLIELKIREIVADFESQNQRKTLSFIQMLCGENKKSICLGIWMGLGLKLTGHDFIMFFSTDLFNKISGKGF